jgi:hypothetical protein
VDRGTKGAQAGRQRIMLCHKTTWWKYQLVMNNEMERSLLLYRYDGVKKYLKVKCLDRVRGFILAFAQRGLTKPETSL